MNWLFLTLLSVLTASAATILQRILMKDNKSDPYTYAIVFHFLLGFLNLGFAPWHGSQLLSFSGNFLILLLASVLWALCSIFLFKALQLLEASEITIVSGLRIVVTIIASVFFLQETFDLRKIIGAIIIFAATLHVVNFKGQFKFNKGLLYVFAMTLFAGLAIVADSINVRHCGVVAYNMITNFLTGFIILIFAPKALVQWRHFAQPNFLMKMLSLAVFSTAQGILYLMALASGGKTAQVGTVRQASVVVTIILAIIFLNERDNIGRKLAASVLVTFGVILLS